MSPSISAHIDLRNYELEIEDFCRSLSVDSSYYIRTIVHHVLDAISSNRPLHDVNSNVAFTFDIEDEHGLREFSNRIVAWIAAILQRAIPPVHSLSLLTLADVSKQGPLYGVQILCRMAA